MARKKLKEQDCRNKVMAENYSNCWKQYWKKPQKSPFHSQLDYSNGDDDDEGNLQVHNDY